MTDDRPQKTPAVSLAELSHSTKIDPMISDGESGHRRLRCLVTNDDGIESEGLRRLALVAADAGFSVVVAAPQTEASGASASILATEEGGRFIVDRRELLGLEEHEAYAVDALPAFIALTAVNGAFGDPPDLVLSGINNGPNTGHAILHSGTVGAALTAAAHHVRSMAVSLGVGERRSWDGAVQAAAALLPALLASPAGTVLNLNVPDADPNEIRGLRRAPLASFGAVQTNIVDSGHGYVQIGISEIDPYTEPDSDAALLADGWATVTALRPVCQHSEVDLPGVLAEPVATRS